MFKLNKKYFLILVLLCFQSINCAPEQATNLKRSAAEIGFDRQVNRLYETMGLISQNPKFNSDDRQLAANFLKYKNDFLENVKKNKRYWLKFYLVDFNTSNPIELDEQKQTLMKIKFGYHVTTCCEKFTTCVIVAIPVLIAYIANKFI